MTAGWSRIVDAPRTAHRGVARRCQRTINPSAMSARLAGAFMIARIAGSIDVVAVRNAGSIAESAAQMKGMTGGNEMF